MDQTQKKEGGGNITDNNPGSQEAKRQQQPSIGDMPKAKEKIVWRDIGVFDTNTYGGKEKSETLRLFAPDNGTYL